MIPWLESARRRESIPFGMKTLPFMSLARQKPHSPERQEEGVFIPSRSKLTKSDSSVAQGIVATSSPFFITLQKYVLPVSSFGKSERLAGLII